METTIKCDICDRNIKLTANSKYLLERDGWSIYCAGCAEKLKLSNITAKSKKIKIYKT